MNDEEAGGAAASRATVAVLRHVLPLSLRSLPIWRNQNSQLHAKHHHNTTHAHRLNDSLRAREY